LVGLAPPEHTGRLLLNAATPQGTTVNLLFPPAAYPGPAQTPEADRPTVHGRLGDLTAPATWGGTAAVLMDVPLRLPPSAEWPAGTAARFGLRAVPVSRNQVYWDPERVWVCPLCPQRKRWTARGVAAHMALRHGVLRRYVCSLCNAPPLLTRARVVRHVATMHGGAALVDAGECGAAL